MKKKTKSWDAAISLFDGEQIVSGTYTRESTTALQLALRIKGIRKLFYVYIIPELDTEHYEAWLIHEGEDAVVKVLDIKANHSSEVEILATEKALIYIHKTILSKRPKVNAPSWNTNGRILQNQKNGCSALNFSFTVFL